MKRFISTILVSLLLLSSLTFFTSCNNDDLPESIKEKNISKEHYQYAIDAIEIVDAYLDGNVTMLETSEQLQELEERKTELPSTEKSRPSDANNMCIEMAVLMMSMDFQLTIDNMAPLDEEDILYWRNELAEMIGEKER